MRLRQGLPGPQMTVLEAAVKQARPLALLLSQPRRARPAAAALRSLPSQSRCVARRWAAQGRGWQPGQVRARLAALVERYREVPKQPATTYTGGDIGMPLHLLHAFPARGSNAAARMLMKWIPKEHSMCLQQPVVASPQPHCFRTSRPSRSAAGPTVAQGVATWHCEPAVPLPSVARRRQLSTSYMQDPRLDPDRSHIAAGPLAAKVLAAWERREPVVPPANWRPPPPAGYAEAQGMRLAARKPWRPVRPLLGSHTCCGCMAET